MPPIDRSAVWNDANPATSDFKIERSPFYQVARLIGVYHRRMNAILKPIAMDVPRWRVLNLLGVRGPATVTVLADESVAQMSTMAKIVQRMVAEGLVSTETSSEDARSVVVSITGKGRSALDQVREKAGIIFETAFRDVTEQEMTELARIARKVHANLSL
jgi:DNA-binding MarR family transcriptional regulator